MSWRWWGGARPALERADHALYARGSADPADYSPRYTDLVDRVLAIALARDDAAEDRGLRPDQRRTCHRHRAWLDARHRRIHTAKDGWWSI